MADNYFQKLFNVNVSDKIEKKNGLSYVSWSYAWAEVKKLFPDANYTIYENKDGWFYHSDGRTCWVKTGVTVNGIEHVELLPVMDFRNNSIPADKVTSTDVNKAIQRSLTKACARHGLGLYVYAGEDLPECEKPEPEPMPEMPKERKAPKADTSVGNTVPQLSAEMAFLSRSLAEIANEKKVSMESIKASFDVCKKAAIKQNVIPDKKVSEYRMDELKAAVEFMKKSMETAK